MSTPPKVPEVRRDLEVVPAEADADGRTAIMVIDPICQSFLRLPWPESEMFLAMQDHPKDLAAAIIGRLGYCPETSDVKAFLDMLAANNLIIATEARQWQGFARAAVKHPSGWAYQLLSQYLFFRIPLVRPDSALRRIRVSAALLPLRELLVAHIILTFISIYLISHQWDVFAETFQRATDIEQLMLFGIAIILLKAVHEFGHGVVASSLGCKVPVIGVAFMMGAPVLYTDTTDTWRLRERWKRLAVVFGGVAAEMIVAGLMAMLWPFLPPGSGRDLAFALMTVSIATSLAINLNPLMRFDGYFALSDWLRMPNLQARAFAFGRWRMRELLFNLGAPAPEEFPTGRARLLVAYAWAVWLYRLVLAAAIAWAVYAFIIKLVGIALFVVELAVLIIIPAIREIKMWQTLHKEIVSRRRVWISGSVVFLALTLAITPWWSKVEIAAVMAAAIEIPVHSSSPGRILSVAVENGQTVHAGDLIAELEAPHLSLQLGQIRLLSEALVLRRRRAAGVDQDREQLIVIDAELERFAARTAALEQQITELTLLARTNGIVVDVDYAMRAGVWVRPENAIARIIGSNQMRARGLIHAIDLPRIKIGARGWFVPDDPSLPRIAVVLQDVSPTVERPIHEAALADQHGGPISTGADRGELVPTISVYSAILVAEGADGLRGVLKTIPVIRGIVQIEGRAESFMSRAARRIAQVLVREQAF